jgi:hypothetical protein
MDSTHFYIALFVHLVGLILGFGAMLVVDVFGMLMIFHKRSLETVKKVANVTQVIIWTGWLGLVVSGTNLIILKGHIDSLTKIKIFFVLMVGINGLFLHKIKKYLEKIHTSQEISLVYRFRIFLTSVISQTGWWGALLIGFVHRHIKHNITWPQNPWFYISLISLVFFIAWLLGEIFFKLFNQKQKST